MSTPPKIVNMKQIAEQAGVSVMTVSNVIHGRGRVSDATRLRVLDLIERLGYRPDPMLRALCLYRREGAKGRATRQTVAFIMGADLELGTYQAGEAERILEGMRMAAGSWSVDIEIFRHDGSAKTARTLSRILYTRGIRGVVLSSPRPWQRERPIELDWDKFAVVACKPIFGQERFHSVGTDHFANGRKLYLELWQRGFRRIGLYLTERLDIVHSRAFKAGVWTEQRKWQPESDHIPMLLQPDWEFDGFLEWVKRWHPQVIITHLSQVYSWLGKAGLRLGRDIGIAVPSVGPGQPNSGINQNYHLMGREALRLLFEKLVPTASYGVPEFPLRLIIPSTWNEGTTLLPPPGQS